MAKGEIVKLAIIADIRVVCLTRGRISQMIMNSSEARTESGKLERSPWVSIFTVFSPKGEWPVIGYMEAKRLPGEMIIYHSAEY